MAAAARAMPNGSYRPMPGPGARRTSAGVAALSRSANASTDATVYPARVADSTNARVEKPATTTPSAGRFRLCVRVESGDAEAVARGIGSDHEEMVEHSAGGLAQPEYVDERFVRTAREAVGDERGALRGFLGRARESFQAAHGRERAEFEPELARDLVGVR